MFNIKTRGIYPIPQPVVNRIVLILMYYVYHNNVALVELASGQFDGSESSGFIEIIVRVTGGISSSPITVTVTSSEQSQLSAMGM